MLPELGQVLLVAALLVALLQAVLPLAGAQRGLHAWMALARPAAHVQLVLVLGAFAMLTASFVTQDFSVKYVADNSNTLLPMVYRYTAVWGAHEGSLLMWTLVLAMWNSAVAGFSRGLPEVVAARVLGVIGLVSVGFLAFLIFTSNPFVRLLPAPLEGRDLNPLLQDVGMIIHPPLLYVGYVGFVVPFAFSIAALLDGTVDARWLRWTRPWTNIAFGFLTIGIALGSWWAYYELGWGGWWFWDPVENASFMPWLAGAALLHSQAVTEKRGSFAGWTLLLAITAFSLSLLGAFLVRSGVLTSVHAFAADPSRGMFILVFLALVIGASLVLYVWRAPRLAQGAPFAPFSRETLLLANNVLLASATGMVLLGTLYPLLADALGMGKISVGPPYFGLLFMILMAPLLLLLPLGPLARWQREEPGKPLRMLAPWFGLAVVIGVIAFFTAPQGPWKTAAGAGLGAWVLLGTARFAWTRLSVPDRRYTLEMVGMTIAHAGVAVFAVGALLVEAMNVQREVAMSAGQTTEIGRYAFHFQGVDEVQGPNYLAERGHVQVYRDGESLVLLHPEKRAYASGGQVMTEAGIHPGIFGDVFVAIGDALGTAGATPAGAVEAAGAADPAATGAWAVRLHIKPFVRWIWFGAGLIALGGFVTAADRRFRRKPEVAR